MADRADWTMSDGERRRISAKILNAGQSSPRQETAPAQRGHDDVASRTRSRNWERHWTKASNVVTLLGELLPDLKPRVALGTAVAAWSVAVVGVFSFFDANSW